MAFQNLPPDLTLPPGGSLTPGSGTIYIGSTQLPVGLAGVGGYKSAIVWFTDAIGLAAGIDYWFMAHFSDGGLVEDGVRFGYYPTGGPVTVPMVTPLTVGGQKQTIIESPQVAILKAPSVFVSNTSTGAAIVIGTGGNNVLLGATVVDNVFIEAKANGAGNIVVDTGGGIYICPGSQGGLNDVVFERMSVGGVFNTNERIAIKNLGVKPYIKGENSSTIDVWQNSATLQTIQGIANCTVGISWRITVDFMVEVRAFIQSGGGLFFAPAAFIQCNMPAGFPTIDVQATTNNQGPHLVGIASPPQTVIAMRVDPGAPAIMYIFIGNIPAGTINTFETSGTFTIAKP